jgi:hypothetical protein
MRKVVVPGKNERAAAPRPREQGESGGRPRLGLRYGGGLRADDRPET